MPTDPPGGWYEPELSKEVARELIEEIEPALRELLCHGLALLGRCFASVKVNTENAPVLMAYRHLLECLDGCLVLLRESCSLPTNLVLRSMFEAMLTIEYLNEKDTEQRAYAWHVSDIRKRISRYRSFDPETAQGRELGDAEQKLLGETRATATAADARRQIASFEEQLKKPGWADADQEWRATRDRLKRRPEWFRLYGGPANLRELAQHLDRLVFYELLYRHWSADTHVQNLRDNMRTTSSGIEITKIRTPHDIVHHSSLCVSFSLLAARSMQLRFRREEIDNGSFQAWAEREIKPYRDRLYERERTLED